MKAILENLHLGEVQTISAFCYSKANFETPWHFHPEHELTYIEESTGTKFIGDYVGAYEPGELVLLRSNLPHCWKNFIVKSGNAQSTVIQWNKRIFAKAPELSSVFEMLKMASKGLIFSKEAVKPLIPVVQQLPSLNGGALYSQLLTLLVQLSDCPYEGLSENSFTDDLPTSYSNRISKIHNFVEIHFHSKVYLKEVAALVNMSDQSFSRFFSKMMGRPFFTFLNEYRINMASRMLLDTDRLVSEIGFACGYESQSFFHKQFNKFNVESPSKYRKRFIK